MRAIFQAIILYFPIKITHQDNSSKEYTSQDWVNAAGATYGYLDNLLQIGGKSLPFANSAAIGSASYNLC